MTSHQRWNENISTLRVRFLKVPIAVKQLTDIMFIIMIKPAYMSTNMKQVNTDIHTDIQHSVKILEATKL